MPITKWSATPLIFLFSLLSACSGQIPKHFSDEPLTLSPCPSTPNCVSSYTSVENTHYIKPIRSSMSPNKKHHILLQLISQTDNAQVTHQSQHYIRAQYTSSFWGFVDDVEFILEEEQIHMRSASRLGYSDLGVNRKRLESIRVQFHNH